MLRTEEVREKRESAMRAKMHQLPTPVPIADSTPPALAAPAKLEEEYFTPEQLSKKWHVSSTTIRRWFRNEPGTLAWGNDTSRPGKKKAHRSLRIPSSVAARVLRRMTRT